MVEEIKVSKGRGWHGDSEAHKRVGALGGAAWRKPKHKGINQGVNPESEKEMLTSNKLPDEPSEEKVEEKVVPEGSSSEEELKPEETLEPEIPSQEIPS